VSIATVCLLNERIPHFVLFFIKFNVCGLQYILNLIEDTQYKCACFNCHHYHDDLYILEFKPLIVLCKAVGNNA
jgi:hypothetical protein